MILRFRDRNGINHVTAVDYIEIEDVTEGEIHDGKWIFKDYEAVRKV